jgi:hypothetical protein
MADVDVALRETFAETFGPVQPADTDALGKIPGHR